MHTWTPKCVHECVGQRRHMCVCTHALVRASTLAARHSCAMRTGKHTHVCVNNHLLVHTHTCTWAHWCVCARKHRMVRGLMHASHLAISQQSGACSSSQISFHETWPQAACSFTVDTWWWCNCFTARILSCSVPDQCHVMQGSSQCSSDDNMRCGVNMLYGTCLGNRCISFTPMFMCVILAGSRNIVPFSIGRLNPLGSIPLSGVVGTYPLGSTRGHWLSTRGRRKSGVTR